MNIEKRIVAAIRRNNWILYASGLLLSLIFASAAFTRGIFFGGMITTINFHLLDRTLFRSFALPGTASHHMILAKYYLRFIISGVIILLLIQQHLVHPLGLLFGLSVVVFSIILVTAAELRRLIFKEAV